MESKKEVDFAYRYITDLRQAWPECLRGVKTEQLAREMLFYKESYIQEVGQTGDVAYCKAAQSDTALYNNICLQLQTFKVQHSSLARIHNTDYRKSTVPCLYHLCILVTYLATVSFLMNVKRS